MHDMHSRGVEGWSGEGRCEFLGPRVFAQMYRFAKGMDYSNGLRKKANSPANGIANPTLPLGGVFPSRVENR